MRLFLNILGFQTAWWACIAGVGRGLEIPALLYGLALAGLHLRFAQQPWQEAKLAAVAVAVGVAADTLLQMTSVISFYGWALGPLSPFWLWLLWGLFAMTLNASLSFLQTQTLWLSALAGLVFGPFTYYAGAQLGAASFDNTLVHLSALALAWATTLPVLVYAAKHFFTHTKGLP
ncbi:DUF2878 domain-containing protein [Limnohabitans sp.]|uniref:DUF2878 domain-containing protein n=1 Tax=Limnohabitans sp. TaxID=1907725 RepID=UPI00286F015C|nr:DUF2878 domain-containing protein [Limnohabitans sp.]